MLEDLTLDQFKPHYRIEEESPVRGVSNTNSKVNVNNVKIGSSSKNNKHLNVNKCELFYKNNYKDPNNNK